MADGTLVSTDPLVRRIEKARQKASKSGRRTWYVGQSPVTEIRYYMVLSFDGDESYTVTVHKEDRGFGHRYALRLEALPEGWPNPKISCSCPAYTDFQMPCKHAAKVQMRLEREWLQIRAMEQNFISRQPGQIY